MDYLKILNQHNNVVSEKKETKSLDFVTGKKVSIVISTDRVIAPLLEVNSIITNIPKEVSLVNIFILHTKDIEFKNLFENINHKNVITKKVFSLNNFNINLVEEFINDDSEYLIYTYADYTLNDDFYIKNSIELMEFNKNIVKVDSEFTSLQNSKLSKELPKNSKISYSYYEPVDINIPDPVKPSRRLNILNFKGFDLQPCVFKKSALVPTFNKSIVFYDINLIMGLNNCIAVKIHKGGFKQHTCSNNLKVSFVMQSFLGDYPGSRSNPIDKFHRIVLSCLSNKNVELIIVSDGCEIVDVEVQKYLKDPRIKYAFVSKPKLRMYEGDSNNKFYRGVPRQVGLELATGDIISYVDSDDIIAPNATEIISYEFYNSDVKLLFNSSWFDEMSAIEYHNLIENHNLNYDNILNMGDVKFIQVFLKDGYINYAPWLNAHVKDVESKWKDTQGIISEDIKFGKSLAEEFADKGKIINTPYYLRCHLNGYFDV